MPSTAKHSVVSALAYTAVAEAYQSSLPEKEKPKRAQQRLQSTTKHAIADLIKEQVIIFPCKC